VRRRTEVSTNGQLERSERWNGLKRGDPVLVSDLRMRGATWEFVARVVNRTNGSETIEVVGGRPGERTVRSFRPERIYAVTGSERSSGDRALTERLSLADAPQLPLG
jgi:hypothetical protein